MLNHEFKYIMIFINQLYMHNNQLHVIHNSTIIYGIDQSTPTVYTVIDLILQILTCLNSRFAYSLCNSRLRHHNLIHLQIELPRFEITLFPQLYNVEALMLEVYLMLEGHHANWSFVHRVSLLHVFFTKALLGLSLSCIWHSLYVRTSTMSIRLPFSIPCLVGLSSYSFA